MAAEFELFVGAKVCLLGFPEVRDLDCLGATADLMAETVPYTCWGKISSLDDHLSGTADYSSKYYSSLPSHLVRESYRLSLIPKRKCCAYDDVQPLSHKMQSVHGNLTKLPHIWIIE